jgi:glutamyl-Q tRNA(Asp) synthetase
MVNAKSYVGRFAPSPTGPLHFGSLVAALASCLEARCHDGRWLLRVEDVDEPRCSAAAAAEIVRALDALGFVWDGPVLTQSNRQERYREVLDRLRVVGGATLYPGTCRNGLPVGKTARAWRLAVAHETVVFEDAIQGRISQDLAHEVGDFVVYRADGYFAYQLAVVVDDADQGVTDVVRGADLLHSTPRQVFLQGLLDFATPSYVHLPVVIDGRGQKLSKQTGASAIDIERPSAALAAALRFLGQRPPGELASASVGEVWAWARGNWSLAAVPRKRVVPLRTAG